MLYKLKTYSVNVRGQDLIRRDQVSYSWYKINIFTSQLHLGTCWPKHFFTFFKFTSGHVGQVTSEHVGQGTGEHVGRGTGEHVGQGTGEHVCQVNGEHVGGGNGEHTCYLCHW